MDIVKAVMIAEPALHLWEEGEGSKLLVRESSSFGGTEDSQNHCKTWLYLSPIVLTAMNVLF